MNRGCDGVVLTLSIPPVHQLVRVESSSNGAIAWKTGKLPQHSNPIIQVNKQVHPPIRYPTGKPYRDWKVETHAVGTSQARQDTVGKTEKDEWCAQGGQEAQRHTRCVQPCGFPWLTLAVPIAPHSSLPFEALSEDR